jgi:hypothetical protein
VVEKKVNKKPAVTEPEVAPAKVNDQRPWYQKKRFIIPIGLVLLIGLSNTANSGSNTGSNADSQTETQTQLEASDAVKVPDVIGMTVADAKAEALAEGIKFDAGTAGDDWIITAQDPASGEIDSAAGVTLTVTAEPPVPPLTLGQENAIEEAKSYLEFMDFSRNGLLGQLTSEYGAGYPADEAEFAIAYLEKNGMVDWNAEAVEAAKSYLEFSSFSRSGLYDQLTSAYGGQFTPDQANYALSQVGY